MPQFSDRVKTTSTSTGSSAITLSASGQTGYQAFPSSLDGETVGYVIEASGGSDWEIGTGVYTHTTLNLSRTLRSSSTGSLLNLGSGTHTVFLTPAFQDIQIVEAFSGTSDLPSASDNHGRIYHVHGEGAMYFAHNGSWVKLANYSDISTYSNATTSAAGLMSAADKTKLDGIEASADVTDTTNVVAALTAGTNITIAADGTISSTASGGGGGSTASALTEQEFTATAGQTVFTVTDGITNADNVVVFLNGSRLFSTDVTVSDTANTVTLAAGATVGDLVTVSEFGAAFGSQYSSTIFTVGTSSEYNTSTKILTASYTANRVAVYLNGVKLLVGTDCTATNGTSIDLTNAAPVTGDKIEVVEHGTLADTVTTLTGLTDTPSSLGTAGQILQVNSGATALEFADASGGSGVTTYTNKAAIDAVSSPSEGDLAYDLAADQLYIRTTSAWTRLALGVDETPVITTEPGTSHTLNSNGATSTVTMVATDPEGFGITYGIAYPTTNNALPNQLATATSINQSTGVYTFDPSTTESDAGTVNVRLSASDGARITTRIVSLLLEFPKVWYGARAVFAGGRKTSPNDPTDGIEYIAIASSDSSTTTFGTLSMDASCSGCSDGTRGVFHLFHSSATNTLEYVTISTTGNSTDFGDTSNTGENTSMCSNGTNGLHFNSGSSATQINIITIDTTGNAASHANLSSSSQSGAALSDETRAVHAHGYSGGLSDTISYLPYTASASVSDFGNLALARQGLAGCSDTHRGIFAGGLNNSYRNEIDYLVIQTTGNATDYADLARTAFYLTAGSDATYAVFAGGYNANVDRMTIQTQANATSMASLAFTKRLIGTACGG